MFIYIADYLQQISGNADLKRVYTKHILKTRQNPISTCNAFNGFFRQRADFISWKCIR